MFCRHVCQTVRLFEQFFNTNQVLEIWLKIPRSFEKSARSRHTTSFFSLISSRVINQNCRPILPKKKRASQEGLKNFFVVKKTTLKSKPHLALQCSRIFMTIQKFSARAGWQNKSKLWGDTKLVTTHSVVFLSMAIHNVLWIHGKLDLLMLD